MKKIKQSVAGLGIAVLLTVCSAPAIADTTVITTSGRAPYFHTGAGPVASVFYWIGDVVVLPFRFVGNLFSGA